MKKILKYIILIILFLQLLGIGYFIHTSVFSPTLQEKIKELGGGFHIGIRSIDGTISLCSKDDCLNGEIIDYIENKGPYNTKGSFYIFYKRGSDDLGFFQRDIFKLNYSSISYEYIFVSETGRLTFYTNEDIKSLPPYKKEIFNKLN